VRGYNDPRAISLPNKIPVWLQSNKKGETYVPFRLNIKDTQATWMGDLPHSWENQVDARNHGKYDQWLVAKEADMEYGNMPLTLGHYTREDLPFYYALADAFTVFDQHFCSALTGTTTNRNYFWTGKSWDTEGNRPCVRNSEVSYNSEAGWKTFPERLEENGISWRVYQNEISLPTGVEDSSLLANFTDNNLEWFTQYNVRYSNGFQEYIKSRLRELPKEIEDLERDMAEQPNDKIGEYQKSINKKREQLIEIKEVLKVWNPDNFEKLSDFQKSLHNKAFTTNIEDPNYHRVEELNYDDNGVPRNLKVPKGDILHQFRQDVDQGKLPTVSWLAAPQKFSDHPSAPWYGAWYVSEVLDILTKNPEVWKKTVFVLTYDENDGYFDHIPPFVAPNPTDTRNYSEGLDTSEEYATKEQEMAKKGMEPEDVRESPIGLGYRVPMVVASPWSKGGWVNSEVCDITSTLMFLEELLGKRTGKPIKETNISSWRREISGNLTSAFRPYNGEPIDMPKPIERNSFMQEVYNASFKDLPTGFKPLTEEDISDAKEDLYRTSFMTHQEPGIRNSCALPYELYVDGKLDRTRKAFAIRFMAADAFFGDAAVGAPFNVYACGNYKQEIEDGSTKFLPVKAWPFAVKKGDSLDFEWPLDNFENENYHLRVYGPNGFFREFKGSVLDPEVNISCGYQKKRGFIKSMTGNVEIKVSNNSSQKDVVVVLEDHAYGNLGQKIKIKKGAFETLLVNSAKSYGWYDFSLKIPGIPNFEQRYAGRVETGKPSKSDPFMGRVRS
jgi:phospholipase C